MTLPPSRFVFRRRTTHYWGFGPKAAIGSIREFCIGGLKRVIDRAEESPFPPALQALGDWLASTDDNIPEALKIWWAPRNSFERECRQLRHEYAEQLERVRQLLTLVRDDSERQELRDIVLVFWARHCECANIYWLAPPLDRERLDPGENARA